MLGVDFKFLIWKIFVCCVFECVVDGCVGEDVEFIVCVCDGLVLLYVFDVWVWEVMGWRGDEFGKFRRCDKNVVEDVFRMCEMMCGEYLEIFMSGGDVVVSDEDGWGVIESWLVNATRNVGAATNDFVVAGGGFVVIFVDDDDEGEKYSVLFIIIVFFELLEVEVVKVDVKYVVKLFKGIEEKFKRDCVWVYLLYVGDGLMGVFVDVL